MEPITKIEHGLKLILCEVCKRGTDDQITTDQWINPNNFQPPDVYGCYTDGRRDYWPLYKIA